MKSGWAISEQDAAVRDAKVARDFLRTVKPLLDRPLPAIRAELDRRGYKPLERYRTFVLLDGIAELDPVLRAWLDELNRKFERTDHVQS